MPLWTKLSQPSPARAPSLWMSPAISVATMACPGLWPQGLPMSNDLPTPKWGVGARDVSRQPFYVTRRSETGILVRSASWRAMSRSAPGRSSHCSCGPCPTSFTSEGGPAKRSPTSSERGEHHSLATELALQFHGTCATAAVEVHPQVTRIVRRGSATPLRNSTLQPILNGQSQQGQSDDCQHGLGVAIDQFDLRILGKGAGTFCRRIGVDPSYCTWIPPIALIYIKRCSFFYLLTKRSEQRAIEV